jgi:hypothetical protein
MSLMRRTDQRDRQLQKDFHLNNIGKRDGAE